MCVSSPVGETHDIFSGWKGETPGAQRNSKSWEHFQRAEKISKECPQRPILSSLKSPKNLEPPFQAPRRTQKSTEERRRTSEKSEEPRRPPKSPEEFQKVLSEGQFWVLHRDWWTQNSPGELRTALKNLRKEEPRALKNLNELRRPLRRRNKFQTVPSEKQFWILWGDWRTQSSSGQIRRAVKIQERTPASPEESRQAEKTSKEPRRTSKSAPMKSNYEVSEDPEELRI
jgi:hypothetical protein